MTDYQLWRLRDVPGQQALTSFTAQSHTRSVPVVAKPAAPKAVKGLQSATLWPDSIAQATHQDAASCAEAPVALLHADQAEKAEVQEPDAHELDDSSRELASGTEMHGQPAQAAAHVHMNPAADTAPIAKSDRNPEEQQSPTTHVQSAPPHDQPGSHQVAVPVSHPIHSWQM